MIAETEADLAKNEKQINLQENELEKLNEFVNEAWGSYGSIQEHL